MASPVSPRRPRSTRTAVRALTVFCSLLALSNPAHALHFVTENYPPLNYFADDGHNLIGSSTDTLREMLRRAGLQASFDLYPWPRAYRLAQNEPDTCVFTTARTPAREPLFQWVGPLTTAQWTLYARADSPIVANSLDDLKHYVVGRYQDDAKGTLLKERGFTLDDARNEAQSLKKLEAGRVDLWAASSDSGPWHARRLHIRIKPVIVFGEIEMFLACHPAVRAADIDKMNAALKAMRADGHMQKIINTYK